MPTLLNNEIPGLATKEYPVRLSLRTFASIHHFSAYTRHAVEEHDFPAAKKCFGLAEELYQHGDRVVRMLIENVFIFSLSSITPQGPSQKTLLKSIIPSALYRLYLKQVMSCGC